MAIEDQIRADGVAHIPKTARGRRTLDMLLQVAEAAFARRGYHETSIVEITQAAGVAIGTYYVYFPDKLSLFRALVDKLQTELRAFLKERSRRDQPPIDREKQLIRLFLEFARSRPSLFNILQESYRVDPGIYFAYFDSMAASYAARLKRAQVSGQISKGDPTVMAWCLIGLGNFLGMRSTHGEASEIAVDFIMKTAGALVEHGLQANPPPAAIAL